MMTAMDGNKLLLIITVFVVYASVADGQAYLFTLENVLARSIPYNNKTNLNGTTEQNQFEEQVDNNTRIFVYKNSVVEPSNELSQTAMDVITIVWYVATFLALAAFFMLMACSDRRCRNNRSMNANHNETQQRAPPTPSPSYSEFAPPSYDTVIKMQHAAKTSIFVIPFNSENKPSDDTSSPVPNTPASVYTIDEHQKTNK